MVQTFKVKDEDTFYQFESELERLGFVWFSGRESVVKRVAEVDGFPVLVHVYPQDKTLLYTCKVTGKSLDEVDATFETGQRLFTDTDGNVHIYETSKPLDEQPEEPRYRYVQVSIEEVVKDYKTNGKVYYYEDATEDALNLIWADDPMFTIEELSETRFYKREEF